MTNALSRIAGTVAAQNSPRDYSAADRLIKRMQKERRMGQTELLEFARAGRFEEVVVGLALLASTSVEMIDQLMQGSRIESLLIPARSAELSWQTTKALLQQHPCHRMTSEEAYENLRKEFQRLSIPTAQRIIRFWKIRSTAIGSGGEGLARMMPLGIA